MDWQRIAPAFVVDGSWRDIYVVNTTEMDWQRVWEKLLSWEPRPVFHNNGAVLPLPTRATEVFASRETSSPSLMIIVGGARVNCHFFTVEEIEFDIDPREIIGPDEALAIADFMKLLGETTAKDVILTPENGQEIVWARFSPGSAEVVWTPPDNAAPI